MTQDRVVFDCNVYFQALIGSTGPAAKCLEAAEKFKFLLYCSEHVLEELADICSRPPLIQRFRFTESRVKKFTHKIRRAATIVEDIPHVFRYPRDPDDEHYVDLAVVCRAHLIASRDRDLLSLNDLTTEEGRRFKTQFPDLLILTPDELLARIKQAEAE
jgi:putative PIN family toxin of toxin-antitoxin system